MTVGATLGAGRAARTFGWWAVRGRVVGSAARSLSHAIAAAPPWSPLRALVPLRSRLKGEVTAGRLVEILHVLDGAGVRYWLAGGWGIDALSGRQARRHDDADIVLDDFERQIGPACEALGAAGFRVVARNDRPAALLADQWALDDGSGCRIDLLELEAGVLAEILGGDGAPPDGADLYAQGRVDGYRAPCLSAAAQRVLHSGFAARPVDRHDLRLLPGEGG